MKKKKVNVIEAKYDCYIEETCGTDSKGFLVPTQRIVNHREYGVPRVEIVEVEGIKIANNEVERIFPWIVYDIKEEEQARAIKQMKNVQAVTDAKGYDFNIKNFAKDELRKFDTLEDFLAKLNLFADWLPTNKYKKSCKFWIKIFWLMCALCFGFGVFGDWPYWFIFLIGGCFSTYEVLSNESFSDTWCRLELKRKWYEDERYFSKEEVKNAKKRN